MSVTILANHHVGYYPGAKQMVLKLVYEPGTGKVLGAQAVGAARELLQVSEERKRARWGRGQPRARRRPERSTHRMIQRLDAPVAGGDLRHPGPFEGHLTGPGVAGEGSKERRSALHGWPRKERWRLTWVQMRIRIGFWF